MKIIGYPYKVEPQRWLFPRALWMPGWHHQVDVVIRTLFSHLEWWPSWLSLLRCITKFFRIETYRSVIARAATAAGFDNKKMLLTPPHFANWRWSTLSLVLSWLLPCMPILLETWNLALFAKARNGAIIKDVHKAITDPSFWLKFRVIYDIVALFHSMRTWASGCDCHEEARTRGEQVPLCPMAGRRMPSAVARLDGFKDACKSRIVGPDLADISAGHVLGERIEEDRRWLLRSAIVMVEQKFGYLRVLPYSLARARRRDVMSEALAEYRGQAPGSRHRISDEFFDESGWITHCENYINGSPIHKELHLALLGLERLLLTEAG